VVRYYYDPTTCKVSTETIQFLATFGHLVRPQLPASAQNDQTFSFFLNGLSLVRDADTLHVVRSWPDHMQSITQNEWLDADILAIWGAHRYLRSPQMAKSYFLFFRTAYLAHSRCRYFWLNRAAPDAMVVVVKISD
jgi:hypothetical protein